MSALPAATAAHRGVESAHRFDELVAGAREVVATASERPEIEVGGVARPLAAAIGHRHATARHTENDGTDGGRGTEEELTFVVAALTDPHGAVGRAG